MMRIRKKIIILTLAALAGLTSISGFAQTEQTQQTQQDQQDQQNEQMLQEIRQLQRINAEQQQSLGMPASQNQGQSGSQPATQVSPTEDSEPNNPNPTQGYTDASQTATPESTFQYPFKEQQIQVSSQVQQLRDQAFADAVGQNLPMSPEQIHRLKQIYDAAQFAASAPAGTPPRPIATSVYVNLSPGSTPPVVRLSQGFVSSLVFLDATGAPWPIAAYDLGNPQAFDIAWDKKDNVLMIQAKTLYTYGNLAIKLQGLNTPVMLTLIPGQSVVDYRADITIPGYGPDAQQLPIDTGLPRQATPVLLDILDGIPPDGSKSLTVSKDIGEAWTLNDKMYLRTQYTLLSPGWLATMASADGTKAYELQKAPMLLVARNGKVIHVKIGGF